MTASDPRRARTAIALALAGLALVVGLGTAHAGEPTAAEKETARAAMAEGRAKFAERDYKSALESFKAAHAIMNVPTTGIEVAKTQVAMGLLIEGRETALGISRSAATSTPAFERARGEATDLAAALAPKIPALKITVTGQGTSAARITVDGAALPAALQKTPWKVNPGEHTVVAAADGFTAETRKVSVKEGETTAVDIQLSAASAAGPTVAPDAADASTPSGGGVPTWAWIAGAGGIVLAGAATAMIVISTGAGGELDDECGADRVDCPAGYDFGGARSRETTGFGLFIGFAGAGALALGASAIGILTASPAKAAGDAKAKPSFTIAPLALPGIGGGGALRVRF